MAKIIAKKNASSSLNVRTRAEKIILSIFFVVFVAYAISLCFPVFWTIYNSFKTGREFNTDNFSLPNPMHWENYVNAMNPQYMTVNIPFALFNTLWRTTGSCLLGLFFTACTSYVVCKYSNQFKWLDRIYDFVVIIMIIPILGSTAAAYEINHNILQIANKPHLWWITWTSGIGFGFLMQYSAWKNLSWNYAEAAFIDGAGNFRVFFHVMLPMVKPILTALFVVNFVSGWGEYMTTILYMDEWPSLGYVIYSLQETTKRLGQPMMFAAVVIAMIPTVSLFVAFQETIMTNMTTGGLKG